MGPQRWCNNILEQLFSFMKGNQPKKEVAEIIQKTHDLHKGDKKHVLLSYNGITEFYILLQIDEYLPVFFSVLGSYITS